MALTEEQKERMRINRERALEIRRKKAAKKSSPVLAQAIPSVASGQNGVKGDFDENGMERKAKENEDAKEGKSEDDVELEEFELAASQYVTKAEAMKMYCLPEGTLAVCSYIERDNPRRKGWAPMKLYERAEIRRRARERHGGLEGLQEERRKRELKRFQRDLEDTKDVFKRRKM
mmetsp:Transcript_15185/g.31040  ORF Transcript_15185/g.31040 Transcript_15185/m.31040 type:complete len:175 (-) Transcript_15185:97-621(-)